jgi:hypothetical protein
VRQICSMFRGGKYVLRKHIRFVHSKRIIQHEVHDTMTEIVEVADETLNRTMAIAMFRHQRTSVVPLRTYHVSPLYLGLCEVQQEAAYLPFPSGKVVFFPRSTGLIPVMTGCELNSSLLSTSRLQDTLENFLAKLCRYRRNIYYVPRQPLLRVGQWGAVRSVLQWHRELISCAWLVLLDVTDIIGHTSLQYQ